MTLDEMATEFNIKKIIEHNSLDMKAVRFWNIIVCNPSFNLNDGQMEDALGNLLNEVNNAAFKRGLEAGSSYNEAYKLGA